MSERSSSNTKPPMQVARKPLSLSVVAASILISGALMGGSSPAHAIETITERCSEAVIFPRTYNTGPHGRLLVRDKKKFPTGYAASPGKWTAPFTVELSGSGRIRWWCNSTKGNWADPGTWRLYSAYAEIGCDHDWPWPDPTPRDCKPSGGSFEFGSSAVDGWTPERSRCDNRSNRIRARLLANRKLEIECLKKE